MSDKGIAVKQINDKEAPSEISGTIIKSKSWQYDLTSYLGKVGREGWEVVGVSPSTTYGGGSMAGEGAHDILIILKRPVSGA